jgi:hypothetical protein
MNRHVCASVEDAMGQLIVTDGVMDDEFAGVPLGHRERLENTKGGIVSEVYSDLTGRKPVVLKR